MLTPHASRVYVPATAPTGQTTSTSRRVRACWRSAPGAGRGNVAVVLDDGREGAPGAAPSGRIVAWAGPEAVPRAWADQWREEGSSGCRFLRSGQRNC
ncbi:hypothetical protein [Actinorugispora endophytica]|uniref:hypothetical protein n=1 Tax=Actinorugispora endophytica TaxID=1605990 RepID=UPI00105B363E|nr:hypothetical protein [Actinorugispora endophytica]